MVDILHDRIIDADVTDEIIEGDATNNLLHVLGIFQNVLQPALYLCYALSYISFLSLFILSTTHGRSVPSSTKSTSQ